MKVLIKRGDARHFDKAELVEGTGHRTKTGNLVVKTPPTERDNSENKYRFDPDGKCLNSFGNPCWRVEMQDPDEPRFEDMEPTDYAALWGCDPAYDRAPCLPGDGYMFYNYAVEGDDLNFLRKFVGAIERKILRCQQEDRNSFDIDDLQQLKEFVEDQILESAT